MKTRGKFNFRCSQITKTSFMIQNTSNCIDFGILHYLKKAYSSRNMS